jgi:hypothetical protein
VNASGVDGFSVFLGIVRSPGLTLRRYTNREHN